LYGKSQHNVCCKSDGSTQAARHAATHLPCCDCLDAALTVLLLLLMMYMKRFGFITRYVLRLLSHQIYDYMNAAAPHVPKALTFAILAKFAAGCAEKTAIMADHH
jgi:hypothetical protein